MPVSRPKLTRSFAQAKADNDPYAQLVHDKLSKIFRQKGAVKMDSPLLMPHSQIHAARKPVQLLDSDGTVVCLPFQLNIPFCSLSLTLTRLAFDCTLTLYALRSDGRPRHLPDPPETLDDRTDLPPRSSRRCKLQELAMSSASDSDSQPRSNHAPS